MHEAHLALASIRARIIQAVSVFAKRTVLRALVDVLAVVTVSAKTGVAHALQASSNKEYKLDLSPTGRVNIYNSMVNRNKRKSSRYLEGTFGVDAVRVGVAAAVVGRAFVDIPALNPIPGETIVARAYV